MHAKKRNLTKIMCIFVDWICTYNIIIINIFNTNEKHQTR